MLELKANTVNITKGKHTFYTLIHLDGVGVAQLTKGMPNYDANNNFKVYNASPLPALYELMPADWVKDTRALKIIDEIFVNTTPNPISDSNQDLSND